MLLKIIRFLRGSVDFTASGKFPERFMNITAKNGVNLWNPVTEKERNISLNVPFRLQKNQNPCMQIKG